MNEELVLDRRCLSECPACMTVEHVAKVLGLASHNIPVLVRAGLLKPLGHPEPNAVKYFAKRTVAARCVDEQWLAKAVDAVSRYWKGKNERRRKHPNEPSGITDPSR